MFPDLSYILHYFFGTQPDNAASIVKTFGLMLVIAILTAAWMLMKELRRKEAEGILKPIKVKTIVGAPASPIDLLMNALLGFFLGFKAVHAFFNFDAFKIDPADIILSTKGNWIAGIVGAIIFAGIKYYEKRQEQLPQPEERDLNVYPHERIGDITILAAIGGIVGAKVFALLEDVDLLMAGERTMTDLMNSFFSGAGMAIYGGLIGGFLVCFLYLKKKKIAPIHVMYAVAPALMVAYGIGRLGCQFSGDGDWGVPVTSSKPGWMSFLPDWMWVQTYPHNVIDSNGFAHKMIENCEYNGVPLRYCTELAEGVYPTSVWEFIAALVLGGILWKLRKRITIPGMLFAIYLFMNGFERFWIEKIRVNEDYIVPLIKVKSTQAEFIAVIMMTLGALGALYVWRKNKGSVKVA